MLSDTILNSFAPHKRGALAEMKLDCPRLRQNNVEAEENWACGYRRSCSRTSCSVYGPRAAAASAGAAGLRARHSRQSARDRRVRRSALLAAPPTSARTARCRTTVSAPPLPRQSTAAAPAPTARGSTPTRPVTSLIRDSLTGRNRAGPHRTDYRPIIRCLSTRM